MPLQISCDEFQAWTNNCSLMHLPTIGNAYTWSNGRHGRNHIDMRLDRMICNDDSLSFYNSISCCTLTRSQSDHGSFLLTMQLDIGSFALSFCFMQVLLHNPNYRKLVFKTWACPVYGCPMSVLSEKLKKLKNEFKIWNKSVFGDVH